MPAGQVAVVENERYASHGAPFQATQRHDYFHGVQVIAFSPSTSAPGRIRLTATRRMVMDRSRLEQSPLTDAHVYSGDEGLPLTGMARHTGHASKNIFPGITRMRRAGWDIRATK